MSYAERTFAKGKLRRPTDWAGPNGCGPAAGGWLGRVLVPDELVGVEFGRECCDPHDLAYAEGGFLGLFWRKPKADAGLSICVFRRFSYAATARWRRNGWTGRAKAIGTATLGGVIAPLYGIGVFALGWTPFTWRWRKRAVDPMALRRLTCLAAGHTVIHRDDDEFGSYLWCDQCAQLIWKD